MRIGLVRDLVLGLDIAAVAGLMIVGLVAVGLQVVNVDLEVELLTGKDVAGVILCVVKIGIERTVGELAADILDGRHVFGEQVDGAAEGRGSNGRGGAGTAVEVDAAEELSREEGPGVVRGGVGVVERNAIEVDVVVAVGKAAEVGAGLAEADAVAVEGKGSGRHRDRLTVVGYR